MRIYLPLLAIAGFLISACNNSEQGSYMDGSDAMNGDSLAHHIAELSSDSFMGRKPFSAGEQKTISYLAGQFRAAGLEPANGNSYLQDVPMVRITTKAADQMLVQTPKGKFSLKGFDEYVVWTDRTDSAVSLDASELVFAGYGVVAPEYNWNDYAGLDVKGKVVLVLVNDPGFHNQDTSLFKGKAMTYYGRWTYKFEEAARQGARGCLIIHDKDGASYPFSVVQNNWNGSRLRLDNRGHEEKLCDVIGWVTGPAAGKLLAAAGKDSALLATAGVRGFKPQSLGLRLSVNIKVNTEYNMSHNVVGKITGSKYPDEAIVYTAHWDHLGIGKPDSTDMNDSIYNGALDNASATAGLLELARAFKKGSQPERTVLFVSVTAEEQGLWGSAWYAQHPLVPLKKTLANINMDGLNWFGKTKDIVVVGKGQNELEDYLADAAAKQGRVISFELHPEAGSYYRSDHFNFAKGGVPALYTSSGTEVIGKDADYGKQLKDSYTAKNYHRPSDEFDPSVWKMDGAIADLQLLYAVGKRILAGREWPKWKEGSEFRGIREQSLK